jgi:hypothetical protein
MVKGIPKLLNISKSIYLVSKAELYLVWAYKP